MLTRTAPTTGAKGCALFRRIAHEKTTALRAPQDVISA